MARGRRKPTQTEAETPPSPPQASAPHASHGESSESWRAEPISRNTSQKSHPKVSKGKVGAEKPKASINRRLHTENLESDEFYDKIDRSELTMINPNYTHTRHFYKLNDNENPALKSLHQEIIESDSQRIKINPEDSHTATLWSSYFYDALYGHPQGIIKPARQISDCFIVGLLNGELIIDATSRARPSGRYWTLNRETRMLQYIRPRGIKKTMSERPFHLNNIDRYVYLLICARLRLISIDILPTGAPM